MYLASETGVREGHGNFWWTAQIALFITFVELVLFFIRNFSILKLESYQVQLKILDCRELFMLTSH